MNTTLETMERETEITPLDRQVILDQISYHELRLVELRAMLPSAVQKFFRFRCKPEQFVWIYASSREVAERKLHERMNANYPPNEMGKPGWHLASKTVDVYDDPAKAAADSPGNLLSALTEADAREFLKDWHENGRGRVADPNRPKHLPEPQIVRDIAGYESRLRMAGKL